MKNQYFGDVNDFKKYALLRLLSNNGRIQIAVCWMLTSADNRTNGKFIDYLREPGKWRVFDPSLFDLLAKCLVTTGNRNVRWIEATNIIRSAVFFTKIISDNVLERHQYFRQFLSIAQGCELVFFDPDNGLEVKSNLYGKKDSSKYLYWHELSRAFNAGHSILIYQHFRREKRDEFINTIAKETGVQTGVSKIVSFRTAHVLFLLVPQCHHLDYFQQRCNEITKVWGSKIQVAYHQYA